jgi:hypothetical protein
VPRTGRDHTGGIPGGDDAHQFRGGDPPRAAAAATALDATLTAIPSPRITRRGLGAKALGWCAQGLFHKMDDEAGGRFSVKMTPPLS